MSAKAVLILCAQAIMVQSVFSQYLGCGINYADRIAAPCGLAGAGLGYDGLAYNGLGFGNGLAGVGLGLAGNGLAYGGAYDAAYGMAGIANAPGIAQASGGALPISSASPIAPTGISVASENAIEGLLAVSGDLPFVSAVALEGALPTAGAGSVTYGCGNGNIGIVSAGTDVAGGLAYGNGLGFGNSLGFGNGLAYGNSLAAGAAVADSLAYGSGLSAAHGFGGIAGPAFGGCGCSSIY